MKEILLSQDFNFPIQHQYTTPTPTEIEAIKSGADCCRIEKTTTINPINIYHQNKIKGTQPKTYTRQTVLERLKMVTDFLAPNYGLIIYDAFRTIETQADLFKLFSIEIKKSHPGWNDQDIDTETQRYIAHPDGSQHVPIPTHNSGGAIDLAIYEITSGEVCHFGTDFDEINSASQTDFFEQAHNPLSKFNAAEWHVVQHNRRILFNLMKYAGFVNYHEEWWHYDLGDCIWANALGIPWVFASMEKDVVMNI